MTDIWAVVPVKEFAGAKQRLSPDLTPDQRRGLVAAMLEDVLDALAAAPGLAGIVVVTREPVAERLARAIGARILTDGARDGHTGAVTAAAKMLAREGRGGMLTVPGDIPAITPEDIAAVLAAHQAAPAFTPAFTIVPAHDERGSNAILMSPPDAVPLRFGDDSFLPHLRAAEQRGLRPTILRRANIGMDIDKPEDLWLADEKEQLGRKARALPWTRKRAEPF